MDIAASSSKNNTTDVPKLNEDRKRGHENDHCEDDESLAKNLREKDAVNLPLEYDANDSRWTLKYREPAPELVELMEHSGVYVNAGKLAECKTLSKDCLTLARRLLTEIFTSSALSSCSVTDETVGDLDKDGNIDSPVLDKHAMIILLKFVAEYGLEENWKITDYEFIQNSVRQKMKVMQYLKRNVKDKHVAQEPVKKTLRQKHVVLPPEYDAHDSRWTLKYREPAEGLVELMEQSRVYVNADKLAECKRLAYDCRSLAQMLLTEIYTSKALLSCSLSDKNRGIFARALEFLPTLKRIYFHNKLFFAELDAHAELVLLNFVDEYALEMGWTVLDFERIRIILLRKLEEIREDNVLECAFWKDLRTGP